MINHFKKTAAEIVKWAGSKFDKFDFVSLPVSAATTGSYLYTLYNGNNRLHTIAAIAIAAGSYSVARAMKGAYDGGEEGKKTLRKHASRAGFATICAIDGFNSIPQIDMVIKSGMVSAVAAKLGGALATTGLLNRPVAKVGRFWAQRGSGLMRRHQNPAMRLTMPAMAENLAA